MKDIQMKKQAVENRVSSKFKDDTKQSPDQFSEVDPEKSIKI
jgi:hypothetical protein